MAREIVLEETCNKLAEADGWMQEKCVFAGKKGSPDRWYVKPIMGDWAYWMLVEFKKPGEPADGIQIRVHEKLMRQGQKVWVIDNEPDFLKAMAHANNRILTLRTALRAQAGK